MIDIIDFSNCKLSSRNLQYGGRAGEKRGIIYNNENWILKFPKNTRGMKNVEGLSYVTSPLNEFIGCNIYKILGYDVQDTLLGVFYNGMRNKIVCACKDFIKNDQNEILIPYTALRNDTNPIIMERSEESIQSASNFNEILFHLNYNTILSKISNAKERFFDMLLIDILINNNDRNEDNWGVIKFKNENKYVLAPIYDCGNSFYGKTPEDRIPLILSNKEKLYSSSTNGITAYENDNGDRFLMNKIVKLDLDDLKKSKSRVIENVEHHFNDIINFIYSIPNYYNDILIMSDYRKDYYIKTMQIRLDVILNS